MTDRFEAMQVFVAVCDKKGFAAAARHLHISPSVVTRLVSGLEDRLGVRLLQRTTRTVSLTEAGTRFLERARRVLADLDEAEASARTERERPRGRLVITAPLLFGRMHVAPVAARLLDAYPEMSVDLRLADRVSNLVEDGVDVAVRIGHLPDSGMIAKRLGRTRKLLVASPGYLAGFGGAPCSPRDLFRHRLVAFESLQTLSQWTFRDSGAETFAVAVDPQFITNSGDAALAHAIGGGGITAAFCYQVEAAVKAGELVEVLAGYALPPLPIQAVYPSSRLLSAKVRVFLGMIVQAMPSWGSPSPDPSE